MRIHVAGRSTGGTFKIRVWGNWCTAGTCGSFKDGAPPATVNTDGYSTTFTPAFNCAAPEWPTPEFRAVDELRGDTAYGEWCDFEVTAR